MISNDGKTEKISRRHDDSFSPHEQEGLGRFRGSSSIDGAESLGFTQTHYSRQDSTRSDQQRNPSSGKILERLEVIERTFLSYVHGHQERLETRLNESKKAETIFIEEVQALKEEIYNLASETDEETVDEIEE